jgi:hypothetical protein
MARVLQIIIVLVFAALAVVYLRFLVTHVLLRNRSTPATSTAAMMPR